MEKLLTFLLTDIEGSTRMWEQAPNAMGQALDRHRRLVADSVRRHAGKLVLERGEGDSTFSVFERPTDALACICDLQRALHAEPWPPGATIRVRAAVHTGVAEERDGDFNSSAVNRCARIRALAHGGQTLVSRATYELVQGRLPEGASLLSLGSRRLKDLSQPESLYQLVHPDLPSDFPALLSLDSLPTNLPAQVSSFIGREREMAEVQRALKQTRLLTLTGSGGCGKTRLALQAAAEALEEYADGIWLVELAALSDASLLAQTVAVALGLREEPGRPLLETLTTYLRGKRLLLLLDNCEHLVHACAQLTDNLLRACPELSILAASREALNVSGETVWRVPSLGLPDELEAILAEKQPAAALLEFDAVRLFADRARAQNARFRITRESATAVAEICCRLDGIPLAIELAAARTRAMTVEQIAGRLDARLAVLTGG